MNPEVNGDSDLSGGGYISGRGFYPGEFFGDPIVTEGKIKEVLGPVLNAWNLIYQSFARTRYQDTGRNRITSVRISRVAVAE